MATRAEYAHWCMRLIEGDDDIIDKIYEALYDDRFINNDQEWTSEDEDD